MSLETCTSENNIPPHFPQDRSAKFYPKPAYFESKSQIMGNWIVFSRDLSDGAKILIFALNGIFTCTNTWVPVQSDIEKRLGWGRDKMRKHIKELKKHGFLRTRQIRDVKGKWDINDFEFCIDASFKEIDKNTPKENAPTPQSQPSTDFPSSENKALPISKTKPTSKKKQLQSKPKPTPPKPKPQRKHLASPKKSPTAPVVVVSSEEKEEAKQVSKHLEKMSEKLDHDLKIPTEKIMHLIAKHGLKSVYAHVKYMIDAQKQHLKDVQEGKSKQSPMIRLPLKYLSKACSENYACLD